MGGTQSHVEEPPKTQPPSARSRNSTDDSSVSSLTTFSNVHHTRHRTIRLASMQPSDKRRSSTKDKVQATSAPKLVVAAIDFGTTYSGYAYSLGSEFEDDPLKIHINNVIGSTDGLITQKVPTAVLFDKEKNFHSFGYSAEDKYAQLAEEDKHVGWRYYRRFKMMLHRKKVRRTTKLRDDQGNTMLAMDVFAAGIGFMKDDLLKKIRERVPDIRHSDLLWILTVPAIWDDDAKQFMRESAQKAGISGPNLKLALEPEAAAIYCKEVAVKLEREEDGQSFLKSFSPGSRFMVLDLGGGTADITVHEVQKDGRIVELVAPSGGPWGGRNVDEAFFNFLNEIFSSEVTKTLREDLEYKADDLDLQRAFELKKRTIDIPSEPAETLIKLPSALFELHRSFTRQDFNESLKAGPLESKVRRRRDKLHVATDCLIKLFEEPIESLLDHVTTLLTEPSLAGLNTLMLVGGLSESEVVKTRIKNAFPAPRYNVIVPSDAQLSVLKGAVIYGFNPDAITSRKMPCTYGVSTAVPFDSRIHPEVKKVERDGIAKCEDVFKPFITAGATFLPGQTYVTHTLKAPFVNSATASVEIYKTVAKQPAFVDEEGSHKVGKIQLGLTRARSTQSLIDIKMLFDTELTVEAQERDTERKVSATFNCL